MGLGGVAIAALPSVVHLQLTFSDRLGGSMSHGEPRRRARYTCVLNPKRPLGRYKIS